MVITGRSGAGKSGCALGLMALGANLLADDITVVERAGAVVMAHCPEAIRGRIEARGVGILNATVAEPAPVALLVDIDQIETERLPPLRTQTLLGVAIPCLHNVEHAHFLAAIMQYMRSGRHA